MTSRLRKVCRALLIAIAAIIILSFGCSKSVEPEDKITIASINPARAHSGDTVTINGVNFGWIIGMVKFDETPATILCWTNTYIACIVPPGSTEVNVAVQSHGRISNLLPFIIESLTITSISPKSGPPGTTLTISGPGFGNQEGIVIIGEISAEIVSWSDHKIVAIIPGCAQSNDIVVRIGTQVSNLLPFTVTHEDNLITSLTPSTGWPGMEIAIRGSFYCSQPTVVKFDDLAAEVLSWSDTLIMVKVPQSATAGSVVVTIEGVAGNSMPFNIVIVSELMKKLNLSNSVELSFKGFHTYRYNDGYGSCDTTGSFSNMALGHDWKVHLLRWAENDFSVSYHGSYQPYWWAPPYRIEININGHISEDGELLDSINGIYASSDFGGHNGSWQGSVKLSFTNLQLDSTGLTDSTITYCLKGPDARMHIGNASDIYYWDDAMSMRSGGHNYISTDWENAEHPPEITVIFRRR